MCCVDGAAGSIGQLNLNVQAQSVCSRSSFSCVVNFRLEQVITPSLFASEEVICAACELTITSKRDWALRVTCACLCLLSPSVNNKW
jgi:hypothetical protein